MIGLPAIDVFLVRNRDGHWFRSKGYGGYGQTWVDDIRKAKLYTRLAQARSRVTYFAAKWPDFGTPEIVRLVVSGGEVLDEAARVEKATRAKRRAAETAELRTKQLKLSRAQAEFEQAKARLDKARSE